MEAAIDLAGICAKVTVLEFMESLKADQVLQDKLFSLPNVEVQTAVQTLEVQGNGEAMTALRIKHRQEGTESVLPLDGVFVQIGLAANSQPFAETLETNRIGEILVDKNCRTACRVSMPQATCPMSLINRSLFRWEKEPKLLFQPSKTR